VDDDRGVESSAAAAVAAVRPLERGAGFPEAFVHAASAVRDQAAAQGDGATAALLRSGESLHRAADDALYALVGGATLEDLEELALVALVAARPVLRAAGME
jgi:hypothetical protein